MPRYKLTGTYCFAPDRGSPDGNKESFVRYFDEPSDEKACEWVRGFVAESVETEGLQLMRVLNPEQLAHIKL